MSEHKNVPALWPTVGLCWWIQIMKDGKEMENVMSFGSWLKPAVCYIEEKRLDTRSLLRQVLLPDSFFSVWNLFSKLSSKVNVIMFYPLSDALCIACIILVILQFITVILVQIKSKRDHLEEHVESSMFFMFIHQEVKVLRGISNLSRLKAFSCFYFVGTLQSTDLSWPHGRDFSC